MVIRKGYLIPNNKGKRLGAGIHRHYGLEHKHGNIGKHWKRTTPCPLKGLKRSQAIKDAISKGLLGHILSDKTKSKIAESVAKSWAKRRLAKLNLFQPTAKRLYDETQLI